MIVTYGGRFVPVKLKVCNSLILYDSPWLKVSKVFDRNMEYLYLRLQSLSEEPQVSLSWSIENITYRIQSLWQAFSNRFIVNSYLPFAMPEKIYWFQTKSTGQNFEIYWSDLSDLSHVWQYTYKWWPWVVSDLFNHIVKFGPIGF